MGKTLWFQRVLVSVLLACCACHSGAGDEDEAKASEGEYPAFLNARLDAPGGGGSSAACALLDLLFVVDNSGSMREEQAALREQFPRLIRSLTSGETANGQAFPPVKDLHLGVVSSDMGLVGIANNFPGCNTSRHVNGGDDGRLLHPANTGPGCASAYPQWLSFAEGQDSSAKVATDFGCIANLGTMGCGFEQQLESGLKALWPKNYVDLNGMAFPPDRNPILFLSTTPEGRFGRGDQPPQNDGNGGFLRSDPETGGSYVAIILVTDEEDCSSRDTSHFISTNDPNNPLSRQGINLRCFYNKQNLYNVDRYVKGYQGLRPGKPQLVMFGAIVGVPVDLVSDEARMNVQWDDQASRDAYYDAILNDSRMREVTENEEVPALANVKPSCSREDLSGARATAYPPRRIVEVAKGIGANAVVQSICQDDFSGSMGAIAEMIGSRLAVNCSQ